MDGRKDGRMDAGGSIPFREVVNTFIFRRKNLARRRSAHYGVVNSATTEIDNSAFLPSFLPSPKPELVNVMSSERGREGADAAATTMGDPI